MPPLLAQERMALLGRAKRAKVDYDRLRDRSGTRGCEFLLRLRFIFALSIVSEWASGEVRLAAILIVRAVVIDRAADGHLAAGGSVGGIFAALAYAASTRSLRGRS